MKASYVCLLVAWLTGATTSVNAQQTRLTNVPATNISRTPVASGLSVLDVFDGRFPCASIHSDWKLPVRSDCEKMKWRLTLYQAPDTHQPTTYVLNRPAREGKWTIVRGTKNDPEAIVYQLDADKPEVSVYLLKGSDDVLFVLDQQRNMRVGDAYLSYTLNRVVN